MEMSMNTVTHTTAHAAHTRSRKNTLLWTAQILLAAFFAFAAVPKLGAEHTTVLMFDQLAAGQWLRYLVGTAELAGAIGLLIPRLTGLAAAGLAADMAGASIINATVLHSHALTLTVPLCIALALIARTRWPQSAILGAQAGH
jgi:putative oxidoreductase